MLARICSFAAVEPKRVLVVHSLSGPAPPSTDPSMAFENAWCRKWTNGFDLNEVSSIIEAHSGTIMVEETDGEEAQFTFILPASGGSAK